MIKEQAIADAMPPWLFTEVKLKHRVAHLKKVGDLMERARNQLVEVAFDDSQQTMIIETRGEK
jgi:acyl-CoA reductase-like NAD-dependent aldehyde dehydrogenase